MTSILALATPQIMATCRYDSCRDRFSGGNGSGSGSCKGIVGMGAVCAGWICDDTAAYPVDNQYLRVCGACVGYSSRGA